MGWFEGALSGATGGSAVGGPIGAAVGGLFGGLFGGFNKPKVPKELQRLYAFQYSLADQQRRFAQSTPLSDPAEQAAYAQARGQLGSQLADQRGQLGSLYGLADHGNFGAGLQNVQSQQTGSLMALQSQHLLAALQQRRQAITQASGIAANAAGAVQYQQQPQVDLAGAFGDLARVYSTHRALQDQRQQERLSSTIGQHPVTNNGQPMGPPIPDDKASAAGQPGFNPLAQVQALPQFQGQGYGTPEGMNQPWQSQMPTAVGPVPLGGARVNQQQMGGVQGGWNFQQPRYRTL